MKFYEKVEKVVTVTGQVFAAKGGIEIVETPPDATSTRPNYKVIYPDGVYTLVYAASTATYSRN